MARDVTDAEPVNGRRDLVDWFEAGCKAPENFKVGSEHEKIPFYVADRTPVPYEGEQGIGALLQAMRTRLHWEAIEDRGRLIGLYDSAGGGAISLEPGGQFELSGAQADDVHALAEELSAHLEAAHAAAEPLGIGFLALGMSPKWTIDQTPRMPKSRYRIMADYMPKVGKRGLDMMYRTATAQANLDYASEADMVVKLRVGVALQPILTALFANSPFTDATPNGFLSARSEIWRDTDPNRTGMLPFAFEPGMGFERYIDYALDVPMYFVKRGAVYHDVAGASFHDLLDGRLPALPGEKATISDWANHLSTIFPEVRLKRYLEMRGADVGPPERIVAQSALMVGLYYDARALDGAAQLIREWSGDDRQRLRDSAPRLGLSARVAGRSAREIARDVLALARDGLRRRGRMDALGRDETCYLDPLDAIVETGLEPARTWLEKYNGAWRGSIEPIFAQARI